MIDSLQPFVISFLIGLLIGIERERSHPVGSQAIGVRTFILLSLLGTLVAWARDPMFTIAVCLFVFSAIIAGYLRSSKRTVKKSSDESLQPIGLTTELSGGVVFCLGYVAYHQSLLAAILGGGVLLVLLGRERLHAFSREQLTPAEIHAATIMLIIGLGILPFLPDRTIDPWQLFNPRLFGILIAIIAALQFTGYVAIRLLGQRFGLAFTGFFGGLISSTAVYITLPRFTCTQTYFLPAIVAAAVLARVAMLLQLGVVLLTVSPQLLSSLAWPMVIMLFISAVIVLWMIRYNHEPQIINPPVNPLDLQAVLRLSLIIGGMIFLIGCVRHYLGNNLLQWISFLGGLFEIRGAALAVANLFTGGQLRLAEARQAIALAIVASDVTKLVLLWSLSRNRFALITSLALIVILAGGAIGYMWI